MNLQDMLEDNKQWVLENIMKDRVFSDENENITIKRPYGDDLTEIATKYVFNNRCSFCIITSEENFNKCIYPIFNFSKETLVLKFNTYIDYKHVQSVIIIQDVELITLPRVHSDEDIKILYPNIKPINPFMKDIIINNQYSVS